MAGSGSGPPSRPSLQNPRAPAIVMIENGRFGLIGYGSTPNSFTEVYAEVIGPTCTNDVCHYNGVNMR
jgi:hypothetical protein